MLEAQLKERHAGERMAQKLQWCGAKRGFTNIIKSTGSAETYLKYADVMEQI